VRVEAKMTKGIGDVDLGEHDVGATVPKAKLIHAK
jgi:hypothetical protein